MTAKKNIAVFFGGRSPEHDVSIVTGIQVFQAIDSTRYSAFPVYIATDGTWLVGEPLLEQKNYLPDARIRKQLISVALNLNCKESGMLYPSEKGLFRKSTPFNFDVAIP